MNDRLVSGLSLSFLALLVVLLFWLNQSTDSSSPASDIRESRTPDYIVETFTAVRMDEHGNARKMILGKRMQHYPDDDSTDLEQPRLIDTQPGKPPVQLTADHARISGNGEDIYLSGNVRLTRNAGKGRGESTLTTSLLHLRPDDDIARTDKPVVIAEAHAIIRAVGMVMNNRTGAMQLLSQVRVVHDKRP